ncbi:hypothetical protein VMCG_02682 [Cytospora schulzeri]|uniref:Uncharacterized protein n=1 Tax=Cytospora schulzeri TaxID=448051 RepID=A0A423WZM0_9PEZI|nr:hypothetical protein VMCG_02682 [Valsa malicola]
MSASIYDGDISISLFLGFGITMVILAGLAVLARVFVNLHLPLRKHLGDLSSATALHSLWSKTTATRTFYSRIKSSFSQRSLHMRGQPTGRTGPGKSEDCINNAAETQPMN